MPYDSFSYTCYPTYGYSNCCYNPCPIPCQNVNESSGSCNPCNPCDTSCSECTLYGDGSAGNLTITQNTNWCTSPPSNNNFMFRNLTINSGITLTVPSGIKIRINGYFNNNGFIVVESPLPGEAPSNSTIISGGFPLVQANSQRTPADFYGGVAYNSGVLTNLINPGILGGGNGAFGGPTQTTSQGGSGGGVVSVYAKRNLTNSGTILAAGGNGDNGQQNLGGSGGGAGGIVILVSKISITNSGTINVSGGSGAIDSVNGGGGGGGGLIHLLSPNANAIAGTLNISGGGAGNVGSGNVSSTGGGGGAMGGNGGDGQSDTIVATAGSDGLVIRTQVCSPECLFC